MKRLLHSLRKKKTRLVRQAERVLYPPMQPKGIVLGAQKGGTTALYHYLCQHPGVQPSLQKEIHFFNCDAHYERGVDFYHSFFEAATPARAGRVAIDVTPGYLVAGEVTAARIAAYNPDLPLLALLREPASRAFSAWQMFRKMCRSNPAWFSHWVESDRLVGFENMRRRPKFGESFLDDVRFEIEVLEQGGVVELPLIQHGLYCDNLGWFYQKFPASQIKVMFSDELKRDTRGSLHGVEEHFGLSHHAWSDEQIKPFFEGGYAEKMPEDARALLADYYRPHNRRLFDLLGREMDWG